MKLLIRILFKLLSSDDSFRDIDADKIEKWLASQYGNSGFQEYSRKRTLQILKAFGTLPENERYWMLAGQRLEILRMNTEMKKAYDTINMRKSLKTKVEK